MRDFDTFVEHALVVGKGRKPDGTRRLPTFIPSGDGQDMLFDKTRQLLVASHFRCFDVTGAGGYRRALNSFAMRWPVYAEGRPLTAASYAAHVEEAESRLLIVGSSESMPRFWTNLYKFSALHIGVSYPPVMVSQDKCIAIPDAATVCVLVKEKDFASLSAPLFDPVFKYTSEKASWAWVDGDAIGNIPALETV